MTRLRALAALWLLAAPAGASEVYIGLEGSSGSRRWTLGLADFAPEDSRRLADGQIAFDIRKVVSEDLLFSRYFQIVEKRGPAPEEEWRKSGAALLLEAKVGQVESKVMVTVKLRDLSSGEAVLERYYRQNVAFWRSAAHRIADDVVKQVTGRPGIAETKIAFVNDRTGAKELYVMDYDGENQRKLTSNRSINLLPRWSPDRNAIAFTSYKNGNPDLFLLDLARGSLRPLSTRQGINLAGGFSPDGDRLAVTLSDQKSPNIYVMNMADESVRRVTTHFGVEASPTFSPDGRHLAFVSNRAGNPEIHILELATGRLRRLTRLNWCDAPSWSPTGEWIAFSGRAHPKDRMDIFLVDVTGTRFTQVTHGEGSNEDPSWSPDGRFIAFTSTRDGRRRLYVMDADGSAPHPVGEVPGGTFTPHWSR